MEEEGRGEERRAEESKEGRTRTEEDRGQRRRKDGERRYAEESKEGQRRTEEAEGGRRRAE